MNKAVFINIWSRWLVKPEAMSSYRATGIKLVWSRSCMTTIVVPHIVHCNVVWMLSAAK